jgi:hypothetical protein
MDKNQLVRISNRLKDEYEIEMVDYPGILIAVAFSS